MGHAADHALLMAMDKFYQKKQRRTLKIFWKRPHLEPVFIDKEEFYLS